MNSLAPAPESILDLQVDLPTPCESEYHEVGEWPHGRGPATHLQIGLCVHSTGFRCASYVEAVVRNGGAGACRCGAPRMMPTFIPLLANVGKES